MIKDDKIMTEEEEDELMDKQVSLFSDNLSETLQQLSMKCIEEYGKIDPRAATISLAKALAASFAGLTHGLPKKDVKSLLHELFEMIEGDVAYHHKDLKENLVRN